MILSRRVFICNRPFADTLTHNVASTLASMGVVVKTLPPLRVSPKFAGKVVTGRKIAERFFPFVARVEDHKLIKQIRAFKPDLVLCLSSEMSCEAFSALRQAVRSPIALWWTDPTANAHRQDFVANPYDAVFIKDRELVSRLSGLFGNRFHYLPEAMNPNWHRPVPQSDAFRCDVGIAGNLYWYRARVLELLKNFRVKVWGHPPPRWMDSKIKATYTGQYLSHENKATAFSSATVALNTLTLREGHTVNCRMFEIAGCGGLQVMEHRDAAEEFFDPGREILLYKSADELLAWVERALKDRDFTSKLRSSAAARALAQHTYTHRLQKLLATVWDWAPAGDARSATLLNAN